MNDKELEEWAKIIKNEKPKEITCPNCGVKFEAGKAIGYSCRRDGCPLFTQIRC